MQDTNVSTFSDKNEHIQTPGPEKPIPQESGRQANLTKGAFSGIRAKLVLTLLVFGLLPAAILFGILRSQEANIKEALTAKVAATAIAVNDVIDRNLFERYGDVQAFGLNSAAYTAANWNAPGDNNPLVAAMNGYMTGYGIYKLMLLLGPDGKVLAVNSVDAAGKPLSTADLYGRSFADAGWFIDALNGKFLTGRNGLTGTAVASPQSVDLIAKLYGEDGYVIPFSAPVKNASGQTIGVWVNFADFGLVEAIAADFYNNLAQENMANAEITLLDKAGKIIVDYDPKTKGFADLKGYKRNFDVIGKFNLAKAGVTAAQRAIKGEHGSIVSTHARKKIVQASGYAHSAGAYDYPGLGWSVLVRIPEAEAFALWDNLNFVMLLALVLCTLAIIGAGFAGGTLAAKPIRALTDTMMKLANSQPVDHIPASNRSDEIGDMARAVVVWQENEARNAALVEEQKLAEEKAREEERQRDQAAKEAERAEIEKREREAAERQQRADRMEEIITAFDTEIGTVVTTLNSATTEMEASAASMSSIAEQASRQATTVAAASEEASTNVQTVASAAEELSASVDEINRQVIQSNKIAQEAVEEAQQTNEKVEGLAEAAQKIGDVVDLINDIASQTNLLALNATIEAARAGEAGKGFAVVASEVKSLATQTSKATEEIGSQITAIQAATGEAVQAIQGIGSTIGEIGSIATSVATAVEQQGSATREIAGSVQQAAQGTQEVSSNITQVTEAASESQSASGQMLDSVKELSQQSEVLRQQVDKFFEQIRAA